jgi:hypothetical protein
MEKTAQLKLMMDYTLFHIGVYITLSTLLVSLIGLRAFEEKFAVLRPFLSCTLGFFVCAGICGGIVAGSLPFYESFNHFSNASIGPFFAVHMLPSRFWMSAEHLFFWLGVGSALLGLRRGLNPNLTIDQA